MKAVILGAIATLVLQAAFLLARRIPQSTQGEPAKGGDPVANGGSGAAESAPKVDLSAARCWSGWLTLSLALIGSIGAFLLLTNKLVIVPEFRLILVEGTWHCGLRVLLVLICVAAALLVRSARAYCRDEAEKNLSSLVVAVAGGLLGAAFCVDSVKSSVPGAARLYAYPIFCPPFSAFLAWALMEWSLVIFGFRSHRTRAWVSMLALTGLAAFAWTRSSSLSSTAACSSLWSAVVYFSLGRAVYSLMKKLIPVLDLSKEETRASSRVLVWLSRGAAPFLGFAVATVSVVLIAGLDDVDLAKRRWFASEAWKVRRPDLLSAGTLFLCIVTVVVHVAKKKWKDIVEDYKELPKNLPKGVAALLFAWGFSDLLWWRRLGTEGALAVTLMGLVLMVELTAGVPLARMAQESFARQGWAFVVPKLEKKRDDWFAAAKSTSWMVWVGALVVLYQLQTAWYQRNALLVEELNVDGFAKSDEWMGRTVAVQVAHEIKRLSLLINSDSMHRSVLGTGAASKDELLAGSDVVVDDDEGVMGGDVGTSVVKVGTWEFPVGVVFAPLQRPLRALLRTRVVRGSVEHGDKKHLLLATVDGWGAFQATGTSLRSSAKLLGTRIFTAQAQLQRLGLSDDHRSAEAFFKGLEAWRRYRKLVDAGGGYAELQETIGHFSDAVRIDPASAAAQYRLGIALWEDNRVLAAADAFSSAMRVRRELAGPYIALARMLLRVGSAADRVLSIATREASPVVPLLGSGREYEAERLLLRALSLPGLTQTEEAAARLHYCALMTRQDSKLEGDYYRAFYNCSRADVLYAGIVTDEKRRAQRAHSANLKARIVVSEARARSKREERTPAVARETKAPSETPAQAARWSCAGEELRWADGKWRWQWRSDDWPGAERALHWARAAVSLEPDNPSHLCLLAQLERAQGSDKMEHLVRNHSVQSRLGEQLIARAWRAKDSASASGLFEYAFGAYEKAREISGSDLKVINDVAYAFRLWSVAEPRNALRTARTALDTTRSIRSASTVLMQHPPQRQALWASTLGEVLIAQGFFHAAVQVLSKAKEGLAATDSVHAELRWDLAQATFCAQVDDALAFAKSTQSGPPDLVHQCGDGLAEEALGRIIAIEARREYKPFSSLRLQDKDGIRRGCPVIPVLPTRTDVIHLMPVLAARAGDDPNQLRYRLVIPRGVERPREDSFGLHLWNGLGQEIEGSVGRTRGSYASMTLPVPGGNLQHDPVLMRAYWETAGGEKRSTEPLSVYPCSEKGCFARVVVEVEER